MTGSSENKQQGAREQRSGRILRYSLGVKVDEFEVEGLHENKCVAHDKFNWSDAVGYLLVTRCFYSYHCNLQFLLCAYFWRGAFLTSLFLSFVMRTLTSILSFSTACFFGTRSVFMISSISSMDDVQTCSDSTSLSCLIFLFFEDLCSDVLLLPEMFTCTMETFHFLSGPPFLVLLLSSH